MQHNGRLDMQRCGFNVLFEWLLFPCLNNLLFLKTQTNLLNVITVLGFDVIQIFLNNQCV